MSTTEPTIRPQAQERTESTDPAEAHKHEIPAEERAVVVGKAVEETTGANEEVDILVDIAG